MDECLREKIGELIMSLGQMWKDITPSDQAEIQESLTITLSHFKKISRIIEKYSIDFAKELEDSRREIMASMKEVGLKVGDE